MQSTTNYSMNILEGTDIVNVPVQINPNFQTIDSEMFKNKQSGIGTATEVVTGTVHAVVRNNLDADVFRFTATGAWASGDTMTLDGSAVTVHMADGTAPSAGAYIIGAEVVAVVNGTLVTLLTSNGAIDPGVTSFNTRTGAVTPTASDYDASMIDYDNTGSGLTATDTQSAIDELAANRGITKAWENPSPNASSFIGQNVSLNVGTSKGVVILFSKNPGETYGAIWTEFDDFAYDNANSVEMYTLDYGTSKVSKHVRSVKIDTVNNVVTFGNALTDEQTNFGSQVSRTADTNDKLIPMKIYLVD